MLSVIGKVTDIDQQMKHEDYLLQMSKTDGLTVLLNRAAAEEEIDERMRQTAFGDLLVMDVDGFKQINDHYGHAAGDLALRHLANCMRLAFCERDILGRIGVMN